MRLLLTAFFLETGAVLVLAPWSEFWDRNYFAQGLPLIHALMINNFVRGAVSGLGIVNMLAAVAEILSYLYRLNGKVLDGRSGAEDGDTGAGDGEGAPR